MILGHAIIPEGSKPNAEKVQQILQNKLVEFIWFSYRRNFPILNAGDYVNDTGWGCMIRACQMTFAECLKRLMRTDGKKCDENDTKIISWFLDSEAKSTVAPYSIQTISPKLSTLFQISPGKWLKPSTVLLTLNYIQDQYGLNAYKGLYIEVFVEGTLFINPALRKVTGSKP